MRGHSVKLLYRHRSNMKAFLVLLGLSALVAYAHARTCLCIATWGGGTANIRSCSSTACGILGSEAPGYCMDYTGSSASEADGTWYQVVYGAQNGWVRYDVASGPQTCGNDGTSTGCYGTECAGNNNNDPRTCDSYGCGNYGASRGSREHTGVDVICSAGSTIYAPITGVLGMSYPYGDGTCCDSGFVITGTGAYASQVVKVFYCDPTDSLLGTTVTAGQAVATHIGLICGNCYNTGMTDHSHVQLDLNGVRVDPSSWLSC